MTAEDCSRESSPYYRINRPAVSASTVQRGTRGRLFRQLTAALGPPSDRVLPIVLPQHRLGRCPLELTAEVEGGCPGEADA